LRWLEARGGATRWGLGLGGVALVVSVIGVGYLAGTSTESAEWEPLYGGQRLSANEIDRVVSVFEGAKLPYNMDGKGILIVPADRHGEARALLFKQKAGRRSLQDVQEEIGRASSWIEGPADRELRLRRLNEEALEIMIRDLPGIESASVLISRPRSRGTTVRGEHATAIVYLKAEGGGSIAQDTVHAISNLVTTRELDIRPDALTVQDNSGHAYLIAGNPDLGARAQVRLQEEEYEAKIRDRLREIDGVRVFVKFDPLPAEPPALPAPVLGVNRPVGEPAAAAAAKPFSAGKAMVLVEVPIRFYLDRYRARTGHEAAPEDLQPYVDKTEEVIRLSVANAIPAGELGPLKIVRIDVAGPARPAPANPAAASELRRASVFWIGAAGAGATATLGLLAVAGRWLANRRPSPGPSRPHRRSPYSFDAPGPSERVRELVRRDPEAAAGVLQRWVGGGGDDV